MTVQNYNKMAINYARLAFYFTYILLTTSIIGATYTYKNATYDPLKGSYLDSFQDPSGNLNCSMYFVDRAMFFIDGCNSSDPFVRGLNYSLSNVTVPRVEYTSFGVILEVEKVNWSSYNDKLIVNITSDNDPEYFKNFSIATINQKHLRFGIPTIKGIGSFNGPHVKSVQTNLVMNTKMIMILFLVFDNHYECDAYFWVGRGENPDENGKKIPDENGSLKPLKNYYKKSILLTLPRTDVNDPTSPEMTIYDIDYLSIYCPDTKRIYGSISTDFGHTEESPIQINPPFIFNRFFLGEETLLCLPNGTYSREVNLDDSKSELPCLGGSSSLSENGLQKLVLTVLTVILLSRPN